MRVFALFLLAFLAFPVTAESIKIGYIDTEKVVNSLTQYQQENDSIIKEFESKKQELLDLFNHIKLVRANLSKIEKSSSIKLDDLRMSAGLGFAYLSPIGAIGFYVATPVLKKSGDTIEDFGFTLGSGF